MIRNNIKEITKEKLESLRTSKYWEEELATLRREEIENNQILHKYRSKIKDIKLMDSLYPSVMNEDIDIQYIDLPF